MKEKSIRIETAIETETRIETERRTMPRTVIGNGIRTGEAMGAE